MAGKASRPPSNPATTKKPRGKPFQNGADPRRSPGRPAGVPNKATSEIKAFLTSILKDPAYQKRARERLIAGEAAGLEQLAYYYAEGKPKETVDVRDESLDRLWELAARRGFGKREAAEA